MKKTLKNKKGFTLIELIVSLAIFAIASVMLVTLIITAMQISMRASAKAKTHLKSEQAVEDSYSPLTLPEEDVIAEDNQFILITITPRR